jgi:hypothetical protein
MHPLVTELAKLKDSEIDAKISDLTKKYFMTNNTGVKAQIAAVLDSYKEELSKRQKEAWEKMMANRNKDLDKLINVQ